MSTFKTLLSALVFTASIGAAQAATLVGSQRDATGINGLVIDGRSYDIAFSTAPLDALFPSSSPPSFTRVFANTAATAIATFLNSQRVTGLVEDAFYEFNVPFARYGNGLFGVYESFNGGHLAGGWETPRLGYPLGGTNYDHNTVATFTVSAVPLPGAAPLFGGALLALSAIGYAAQRRKAAAV